MDKLFLGFSDPMCFIDMEITDSDPYSDNANIAEISVVIVDQDLKQQKEIGHFVI